VVTDDDVAVQDSLYTAGRRGVGVTVLLEKIAGAAAEQGRVAARGRRLARKVNANGRSMGVALTSCTVPRPASRRSTWPTTRWRSASASTASPAAAACRWRRPPRSPRCWSSRSSADLDFTGGDGVIAFVNGMGGTPLIELYLMYNEVADAPRQGRHHGRPLAGRQPYITSLDMAGCSVTLLKADDEMLRLWDAPVRTPGAAVGSLS
jgi:dihydroxyacetone kinase-like protein